MTYELETNDIQEIYDQCCTVLEVLGKLGNLGPISRMYRGHRLDISGSADDPMLLVSFDARENTGRPHFSQCLCVTNQGTIKGYSNPHLSEVEAGEGDREQVYLPWTNWLKRAYKEACEQADVEDEP